jgi:hypothetical protein
MIHKFPGKFNGIPRPNGLPVETGLRHQRKFTPATPFQKPHSHFLTLN